MFEPNRERMSGLKDVSQQTPAGCGEDSETQLPGPHAARQQATLPVDRVKQILRLLPIKRVFVFMRVNKKWEAAARQVVREKTRLGILLLKAVLSLF